MLRPKLTLTKHDDPSTVYYTYDAHNPPTSGPMLTDLYVKDAIKETGEMTAIIEDADKAMTANVMNGNKFYVDISSDGVYNNDTKFLAGWIREFGYIRKDTGLYDLWMHGYGNMVKLSELITRFFRIAARTGDGETADLTDVNAKASELMKALVNDPDHRPFGAPFLSDYFTTAGIEDIPDRIASIKMLYVDMIEVANRLAESSGTYISVNALDQVVMRYPILRHSGITIKDTVDLQNDNEATTGYFEGEWRAVNSIKKSEGFANRLVGIGGTDFKIDVNKWVDNGSDECYSVDRAIQFVPSTIKLDAIALILSRTATMPSSDLTGEIRLDVNDTPTGQQVGSFSVFRNLVGTSATEINRVNTTMSDPRMQVDKKYWLVILKQGNANQHYKWHHDNGSTGRFATRNGGSWVVTSNSKTYAHRTFSSRQVVAEMSDPASIQRYGTVEAVERAPWILEGRAMDTYLLGILQWSARQRRKYETKRIFSPSKPLRKETLVRLIDSKAGVDADAEIQSVAYRFNAQENGMGTRWADVRLTAYVP